MDLQFEEPLSNEILSSRVMNIEAQLLAIQAELKVIQSIFV